MARFQDVCVLVGFAHLGGFSCQHDGARPGSNLTVTVDTIGGVERVNHRGEGRMWDGKELLRLGEEAALAGAADPIEFGQVVGVVADSGGRIYVADSYAHEIRVFSATGAFLGAIGREGGGPGEFRTLQSLGILGDTLVTLDPGAGRLGLFSLAGEWLGHRPYRRVSGPDVRIYQTGADEIAVPALEKEMAMVYVRHRSEGLRESTPLRSPMATTNFYVFCQHDRGFVYFVPEWAPSLLRVPAPGGTVAEAWAGRYRIWFLGAAGDTLRIIERDQPPLVPSDAEWADQLAQFDSMMALLSGTQCDPRRPVRPEEKDLVRAIHFDARGRPWIERRAGVGWVLDAFDSAGVLRGTVAIPDRVREIPIFIRANRLYVVEANALGVQTVRVLAIPMGAVNESQDG